MKPNEGYVIGQEDLVSQLGLLILEGRTVKSIKTNLKGGTGNVSGLFQCAKEEFLAMWKSCDSIYIEVWLHQSEQFNVKEAMNGYCGYLLIEQWEIEVKQNTSSGNSFQCTERMLIQAVRSKLYFSQLCAWLSLSQGQFPKHAYFRICQVENRTQLRRFIRSPDSHQFPRVNVASTKAIMVSLYYLPHTDVPVEYPAFSWVLSATSHGDASKMSSLSSDSQLSMRNTRCCGVNEGNPLSTRLPLAVRKLEFETVSVNEKGKQMCWSREDLSTQESSQNYRICEQTSGECPVSESREKLCRDERDLCQSFYQTSLESSTTVSSCLSNRSSPFSGINCDAETCEDSVMESPQCDAKATKTCADSTARHSDFSRLLRENNTARRLNFSSEEESDNCKKAALLQERVSDELTRERTECFEKHKQDIASSCKVSPGEDDSTFPLKSPQNLVAMKRQQTSCNTDKDCDILRRNFKTDGLVPEMSRKSLLRLRLQAPGNCGPLISHLAKKEVTHKKSNWIGEPTELAALESVLAGKNVPNSKAREAKPKVLGSTKINKNWSVDKFGNIEKRTKDKISSFPAMIEKDREDKIKEKLRKCCLSEEDASQIQHELRRNKIDKLEKMEGSDENVFCGQRCASIPRKPRYHFRHASTGTLPVFHPSTGLPMSSSPAPFRKTSLQQTMDDICSPNREQSQLLDHYSLLSKSAPTLTTQSLLVNFEESVLNDRLLPDGIVEGFTAELSASGSRKCLPHVTLPVQAYFFRLSDDNAPSPYMGYISLDVAELPKKGYHVPKKGTVQLTLFNPNQTVVKVFVVLYDFSDMQPNFQTFLRQKTTSLVEPGLVEKIQYNLHYLIHLRFASSKSGRIYLHTDIRVIFARHPPEQVHLRTATCGPTNPKYVPRQDTREEF